MWQPYPKVIARKAAGAVQVLDRFHIMAHLSKAIDEVRAKEAKRLKAAGYEPVLKGMRFCLLKRPENLCDSQEIKLAELLRYNLRTVRAYLLKEEFQLFWHYVSAAAVKGLNNKLKLTSGKAYGFRAFRALEIALYHAVGHLPEPKVTHRFC